MRTAKLTSVFLTLFILLSVVAFAHSESASVNDAQTAVHDAYKALLKADSAGADTGNLTNQLNVALNLTSEAQAFSVSNPQEAKTLATQAQELAQNVTEQASTSKTNDFLRQPVVVGTIVAALLAVGVSVYFLGPKLYWKVWLRLRKNYRVRIKNSMQKNRGFVIAGEQISAVVLGITIIIAFFAASQFFLPKNLGETFSEFGILGPNNTLGDYPSAIVAGDPVNLNVYVGNQMGRPMYYIVMIKTGDNETLVNPSPGEPIQQFASVVPRNGTWTFPISLTLTHAGLNQRIIFELWIYNETLSQNQYHDRWNQLWLNVTAPAS